MRKTSVLWLALCGFAAVACGPGDDGVGASSDELTAPTIARFPAGTKGYLAPLPDRLDFVLAPGLKHLEEKIVLQAAGPDMVMIRSIALRDDSSFRLKGARHFQWQAPQGRVISPGDSLELSVKYLADDRRTMLAVLEIETDSVIQPKLRVRLTGTLVSGPTLPQSWQPRLRTAE